jgi:hypothetical protein
MTAILSPAYGCAVRFTSIGRSHTQESSLNDQITRYRGGDRVRLTTRHPDGLHDRELIVVAPTQAHLSVSDRAVQCFDPSTGYIWPVDRSRLVKMKAMVDANEGAALECGY